MVSGEHPSIVSRFIATSGEINELTVIVSELKHPCDNEVKLIITSYIPELS